MKAFLKLLLGVLFIFLLGLAAIVNDAMPGSPASAEQKLAESVRATLAANDADWASAQINGQQILLTGEAPSASRRHALVDALAHAEGTGGPLFGGVTDINTAGLTVAEAVPTGSADAPSEVPDARNEPTSTRIEDLIIAEAGNDEEQNDPALSLAVQHNHETNIETPHEVAPTEQEIEEQELEDDCAERMQTAIDRRRIGFLSARADIDNTSRAQLRDIADVLIECPQLELRITGHTDASGNAARNMQLSGYRADAVRAFLSSVGAPADRLSARGVGSSEALVSNDTPDGRERNRRIEIEVIRRDE